MSTPSSTSLAFVLGIGLTLPGAAEEAASADVDNDLFVTREEATAHSEWRFHKISHGSGGIALEQFEAAMIGSDALSAEADSLWNPETEFNLADLDQDGTLDREEWMRWRQGRFQQAAGAEGHVTAGLYKSIDSGGPMVTPVDAGTTGD